MGMVALKCPQCNGDIQLDATREYGFCSYCGTKIMQDKIFIEQKVTIKPDNGEQFENLIILARRAREMNEYKKMREYYDAALLINPNSWESFFYNNYNEFFYSSNYSNENDKVLNNLKIVFSLIRDYVPIDKQKTACDEVVAYSTKSLRGYDSIKQSYDADISRYKEAKSKIGRHEYGRDEKHKECERSLTGARIYYRAQLEISIICNLKFGDIIQEQLGDEYSYAFVNLWKEGISIIHKAGWYNELLEENKIKDIDVHSYEEKIKKYDPSYIMILNSNSDEMDSDEIKESGGCYVATAVYGSYDCPEVWTLRRYRDNQLSKTWYGRLFIHTYYAISPTLVKWFGNTQWFKNMWKPKLDKMVDKLQKEGVENTPYQDRNW